MTFCECRISNININMIILTFRPSQPVEAEAIISSPVVIVPVVLLVSLILIVVAVVCFIRFKR